MEGEKMFCKNCGETISAEAEICPKCGVRAKNQVAQDQPNWGVNILSLCCITLVGIIVFFVWKKERPVAAKSALIFGLIPIVVSLLFYIVFFVLLGVASTGY